MDVAIIGNGICALSSAFRLSLEISKPNKIYIVGNKKCEGSASKAAAAMLNSYAELESTSLRTITDNFNFDISRKATKEWRKFNESINQGLLINGFSKDNIDFSCGLDYGTFLINNTAADCIDDENYDFILNSLLKYNESFQNIDPKDIPNYKPTQKKRATRSIYIDNEGWINPRRFINKIENLLKSLENIIFISEDVNKLFYENSRIKYLLVGKNKKIFADKYIIAAGSNSYEIIKRSYLPIKIPRIFYGVGVSIELKCDENTPTKCIRTPNRGLACGIYAAPYSHADLSLKNNMLLGATNFLSASPIYSPKVTNVETLLKALVEQINHDLYRAEIVRTNIGWRPITEDTFPLIGQSEISNLIFLTGTNRDGFHKAPIYSDYICSITLNKNYDSTINLFKPCRELIRNFKRNEAIEKSVKHLISADYQHGFNPSVNRMPDKIEKMYRNDLEKLHDKVGAYDWGIPTEMLDMYRYGHTTL